MPENIRDQYQYFTQANMKKFKTAFSDMEFSPLESCPNYVKNHLLKGK